VVNYGSHGLLVANLVPLSAQDPDLAIVVVDNFTTDDESAAVVALGQEHGWTVLLQDANLGFGAGANRGAQWAIEHGARHILFLNPDATIDREDVERLQNRLVVDPMTMVSPTVKTPDGRVWFDGSVVDLESGTIRRQSSGVRRSTESPWLSGACLMVSRELWRAVGGFNERYFLYWEDVDLSYRVQQTGGRVDVVHDAVAIHSQGGTQRVRSVRAKSDTYYYHMVRNRLLFAGEHLERRQRTRWLLRTPRCAWNVVLHGGRRQLLYSWSPLAKAARGALDGAVLSRRAHIGHREPATKARPIVVLQSVPTPKPTTNPYNILLAQTLDERDDVEIRMFGWREALLHHHDVFHAHWPEALITRRGLLKTRARQALFAILLLKWRLNGTTVVRTVHNIDLPSDIDPVERYLLNTLDKMTVGRVTLNPFTPVDTYQGPVQMVLHGHYLPWFDEYDVPSPVPGRVAFFGAIRRYKGVEGLVRAFHESTRADLTLAVAGRPSTTELAEGLVAIAGADRRIKFDFEFLDTAKLVEHVGKAELVALPHTDMHNSGSAIAALSLGRPVLMQDNEVNRWLRNEVGAGWIHLYEGDLTSSAIVTAVNTVRKHMPLSDPNLSARDWQSAGTLHTQLYKNSILTRRARRKSRRTTHSKAAAVPEVLRTP